MQDDMMGTEKPIFFRVDGEIKSGDLIFECPVCRYLDYFPAPEWLRPCMTIDRFTSCCARGVRIYVRGDVL